jgi:hypothetical protein
MDSCVLQSMSLLNIHNSNKNLTKSWACNHECKNPQCSIIKQEQKKKKKHVKKTHGTLYCKLIQLMYIDPKK